MNRSDANRDDVRRDDMHSVTTALLSVLLGSDRVESFLLEVARSATGLIEGALTCGVTVQATPRSRMLGATSDPFAERMDAIQYEVDDGPCLTSLRTAAVVAVPDIATDPRWPAYSRRGRREGAASSLSIPMIFTGRAVGALNLYSRRVDGITPEDRHRAQQFADQAAGAVALGARLAESEDTARHLTTALRSRSAIDQAIGALMAESRITADAAFDLLRQRSQHTNTKLRDVARAVIDEITGNSSPEPPMDVTT